MYKIRLQAPKLARKCEIKHWCFCGADGRKVGRSVYGHVIAKFSRINRFSKLLGSKYISSLGEMSLLSCREAN